MLLSSIETSCLSSGITAEMDIIIDPCAGSDATLRAAREMSRDAYGFEISAEFYSKAVEQMLHEDCVLFSNVTSP